jgi:hypothetical protein
MIEQGGTAKSDINATKRTTNNLTTTEIYIHYKLYDHREIAKEQQWHGHNLIYACG